MSEIIKYDPAYEQLDNVIKPVGAGFHLADNGRVSTEFYQASNEVVFVNNGRRFSWTPNDMRYLDEFGNEDTIYTVQEAPLETKGNYARYNRALPDVDDWFIQENDRLKHQILIQGFQPDPSPWLSGRIDLAIGGKMNFDSDLKIVADGIEHVNPFETSGAIHLYDGNKLVFELPQVIAFDSAYERSMTTGKYRVWFNDNAEMMFDIIVDNAWVMSLDRVYPLVIDPTVIVNSGYSTDGNGGRKAVVLDNGWMITALRSSFDVYLYKSQDKGATWTQLCFLNTSNAFTDVALANTGNFINLIISNGTSTLRIYKFDATTVSNTNQYANMALLDSGISDTGNVTLVSDYLTGKLHAAWSSKNSLHPNSFNIRYASSTDGGATWSEVEQVTVTNTATVDNVSPSIFVKDNLPFVVFCTDGSGSSKNVMLTTKNPMTNSFGAMNGAGWYNKTIFNAGSAYSQYSPSTVVDKNGVFHVVWHGKDSVDSTFSNVRYAKSFDGGQTWSAAVKLTSGNTVNRRNASITCDKNNKLYVVYEDNGILYRQTSVDSGASWNNEYLYAGTNPSMLLDPTFTNTLVPHVYMKGSTVAFDMIQLNTPPSAPTGLTRASYDALDSAVFSWTYNTLDSGDSQSAYHLQVKDVATGIDIIDTNKVASTASFRTIAAATLANNKQYQWRVKTWSSVDLEGVWSDYATFYTSAKPSASITNITDGQTYSGSSITIEWSMSDPESEGQSAYRVQLTDSADAILYDSGKVSDSRSRSKTIEYTLANNTSYKTKLTVWDGKDVASVQTAKSINVQYTPPATPVLSVTADTTRGTLMVSVTHPTPVSPQPAVQSVDVYRRKADEITWTRLTTNALDSFVDYTPASGVTYEYKVKAIGNNGTSVESAVVSGSVKVSNAQLAVVSNYGNYIEVVLGAQRNEKRQVARNLAQFAGRKDPVTYFGEHDGFEMAVSFLLFSHEELDKLRAIVDARQTLLYRDNFGRKAFISVGELAINDESYRHYSVSVAMTKTSYSEEV